ncbi:MAG: FecR domain-containing protein [Verrucomicrobiota bacterium]
METGPEREDLEEEIKDAAARWVMRRMDYRNRRGARERSFRSWLEAREEHEEAYREAERALERMESPGVFEDKEVGEVLAAYQSERQSETYFFWRYGSVAAAAAIVFALFAFGTFDFGEEFSTQVSEQRENRLADGTLVSMDAGTRIRFFDNELERRVVLMEGAAVFDIANGDPRPFSVEVGNTVIRDIGTVFSVKKREGIGGDYGVDESVEVAVEEGIVDVFYAPAVDRRFLRLNEGQRVALPVDAPSDMKAEASIEMLMKDGFATWREGRIHYDDRPFAEVLADLQRRYSGEISINDVELAAMKVSGTLSVDRLEEALSALQRILPLEIVEFSRDQIILKRSGES